MSRNALEIPQAAAVSPNAAVPLALQFYDRYSSSCARCLPGRPVATRDGKGLDKLLMESAFVAMWRHLLGWPRFECSELLDILDSAGLGGVCTE